MLFRFEGVSEQVGCVTLVRKERAGAKSGQNVKVKLQSYGSQICKMCLTACKPARPTCCARYRSCAGIAGA